jgi:hypothetical protein
MAVRKEMFATRLQSDAFAGHIIRWVAIFESRLDSVLSAYFSDPYRSTETHLQFSELVLSRLSFFEKIEILRGLKFDRLMKSQKNIVDSLDRLRRLRNALAHTSHMPDDEIRKLRSDKWLVDFVERYPASVGREKNALENRFSLLWKHCASRHAR